VTLQTWSKWREQVEREGMRFAGAPEYQVFPTREKPLKPYQAAVLAARETQPLVREVDAEVVVVDILTTAAGLAAQLEARPWATLIPHVLPTPEPGRPPYSSGARLPRTLVGRELWKVVDPLVRGGERQGRDDLNEARRRVGLAPLEHLHGGISRELALIATFPQLEYPRGNWLPSMRVTGPLLWEQPSEDLEPPPGEGPLVLVAPSTSQDPERRMLAAALEGLAAEPVRVLATRNRRDGVGPAKQSGAGRAARAPVSEPANATLVDWLSYGKAMPHCDVVVCHAGHGTLVRALAAGVPVVACPVAGDMAENAARVAWAGAGISLPRRMITPRGVRLAVRKVLADPSYRERAQEFADWAGRHDGAALAADAVEELAASGK